jgi:hypothetical protein
MRSSPRLKFRSVYLRKFPKIIVFIFIMILGMFVTSCNLPVEEEQSLSGTQLALNATGTALARNQLGMDDQTESEEDSAQLTQVAHETQVAKDVQATLDAQKSTELAIPTDTMVPTDTPEPTPSPTETNVPEVTQTEVPPPTDTPIPVTPTPDFDAWMTTAKILIYEDVSGIYLPRYVKEALDSMGLSYVDVKDALGNFKGQILSGTDWDLIISAQESRSGVKGEFFDYLNEQLTQGTSVIVEMWDLDDIAGGRISTILTRCGIKLHRDWWDPASNERSIWWLVPEHPMFHQPNEGISLAHYSLYWFGDAGDLLKIIPGSEAVLLAGTEAQVKDSYATVATCLDGRFILQTHSSHDYRREDMVRLWQNYIYNTLMSRFEASQSNE